jgi:hypothetical protein
MSATINLADVPDLSAVFDNENSGPAFEPFQDGGYEGVIQGVRSFTDRNGNDRVFESVDAPAASGESRNIKLQVELTRQSDGRKLNTSYLVNYKPEALTQATVQAIVAKQAEAKESGQRAEWGDLFGAYMTIQKLGKLQKVAGVRQLQKSESGGLELGPLFGKKAYFRIKDDDRNPQYKQIADVRPDRPTKATVY